jgi:hypothetical protein
MYWSTGSINVVQYVWQRIQTTSKLIQRTPLLVNLEKCSEQTQKESILGCQNLPYRLQISRREENEHGGT